MYPLTEAAAMIFIKDIYSKLMSHLMNDFLDPTHAKMALFPMFFPLWGLWGSNSLNQAKRSVFVLKLPQNQLARSLNSKRGDFSNFKGYTESDGLTKTLKK